MAAKKAEEIKEGNQYPDDTYEITLPLTEELQDDVTVIVNGHCYRIQRGIPVTVPASVYEVLMNSQRMDSYALLKRRELEQKKKDMDAVG